MKHKDKVHGISLVDLLPTNFNEAVSPKGWNMSKKFVTVLSREVKNLQKYHRQQNEEDFLEVVNYMELQLKYLKKNLKESVSERMAVGDEYVGTAVVDGRKAMLYRSSEADRHSIGKKHGIKKNDYYLLVKGKGADYVVDSGTRRLKQAATWAQGYIKRKLSGTGKERFV